MCLRVRMYVLWSMAFKFIFVILCRGIIIIDKVSIFLSMFVHVFLVHIPDKPSGVDFAGNSRLTVLCPDLHTEEDSKGWSYISLLSEQRNSKLIYLSSLLKRNDPIFICLPHALFFFYLFKNLFQSCWYSAKVLTKSLSPQLELCHKFHLLKILTSSPYLGKFLKIWSQKI